MRPLLALAIVIGILGTVAGYMRFQSSAQTTAEVPAERAATAHYDLEITLTFTAAPDSFGLDAATSLLVKFRGQDLLRETATLEPGKPVVLSQVKNIVVGRNEFYLEAAPQEEDSPREHALRLRILQEGQPVADQTMWSPPGEPVRGILTLVVPEPVTETAEHHH